MAHMFSRRQALQGLLATLLGIFSWIGGRAARATAPRPVRAKKGRGFVIADRTMTETQWRYDAEGRLIAVRDGPGIEEMG